MRGEDRLGGPPLPPDEQRCGHHTEDDETEDDPRTPSVGLTAPQGDEEKRTDGGDQDGRSRVVDGVGPPGQRQPQDGTGDDEGQDADGDVDVEDPAPRQMVDEEAPGQRSADAGEGEDPAEVALVATAFAGAHDVADDGHGQGHESAAAESLDGPEGDELVHVPGQARQGRADQEDDDGDLEDPLTPVEVGDLAVEGGRQCGGEEIRRHHPGQVVEAVEIPHDGRQRRGHDGLVQRGQQHPEHEAAEDDQHLAVREHTGRGRRDLVRGRTRWCRGHGWHQGTEAFPAPWTGRR